MQYFFPNIWWTKALLFYSDSLPAQTTLVQYVVLDKL